MNEILTRAQKKQDELSEKILSSNELILQRPVFHFSTSGGWCNDPNGFSQFGDKVYMFYQYHPYSTQWGPMHWGHVVSDDIQSQCIAIGDKNDRLYQLPVRELENWRKNEKNKYGSIYTYFRNDCICFGSSYF